MLHLNHQYKVMNENESDYSIEVENLCSFSEIEGNPNLVRDTYSNGIVNVDESGYRSYIENYKRTYNEMKKMKKMENEVLEIKNDLNEIKDLLKSILSK